MIRFLKLVRVLLLRLVLWFPAKSASAGTLQCFMALSFEVSPGYYQWNCLHVTLKFSYLNIFYAADNGSIAIGENTNVQDGSTVTTSSTSVGTSHQDTVIGSDVTIGHQVSIHGSTIGDEALIGMGATILEGSKVCLSTVTCHYST